MFSVVIPVYNRQDFLGEAIESALQQRLPPADIIVVDDGSTDESCKIARSFGDCVRVIEQDNAGCAVARNRGVAASTSEYIAFLDSDDVWYPWTLQVLKQVVDDESPAMIAMPKQDFEHTIPSIDESRLVSKSYDDLLSYGAVVGTSTMCVARKAFQ